MTADEENARLQADNNLLRLYLASAEQGRTHFMVRFHETAKYAERATARIGELTAALALIVGEVETSLAVAAPGLQQISRRNPDAAFAISNRTILRIRRLLERNPYA
jgi:hypothetical protein